MHVRIPKREEDERRYVGGAHPNNRKPNVTTSERDCQLPSRCQ